MVTDSYHVPSMLGEKEVLRRVEEILDLNQPYEAQRTRIRAIMRGGPDGIRALLRTTKLDNHDMPVVHLLDSGLTRLAQKLGHVPDVKIDPRADRDQEAERRRVGKRERIVQGYDQKSRMELILPQVARWLPGYGYSMVVVTPRKDVDGNYYPHLQLRDSYDVKPGQWGPDQQPRDAVVVRQVPRRELFKMYPQLMGKAPQAHFANAYRGVSSTIRWEGAEGDTELVEYYCASGTYVVAREYQTMADWIPNPLSVPLFYIFKRFSFDYLQGQYDHVLGLMGMMAKMNILSVLASEDAVFRETNIVGELLSGEYRRGRFAVNHFSQGTRVERPGSDIAYQVFSQIDRLERQLRTGANYSAIEDGNQPGNWVTGQGVDRLMGSADANVAEYQKVMRAGLEHLDAIRLEMDEKLWGEARKPLEVNIRGQAYAETYSGKDIRGNYRTRRVYGVMAGWDEGSKIVTGLQMLSAEVLDVETFQENVYGLENISRVNDRVRRRKAEQRLFDVLSMQAQNGDPRATMAMVQIRNAPDSMGEVLDKFFSAEGDQPSPEEEQMMAAMGGGGEMQLPPEAVSTVLSRLESGGGTDGGVQTVAQL